MAHTVNSQPSQVMRRVSHKSVIGIIRDAVEAWQKAIGQNREYVADEAVKAHHAIGAVERSGIWIEPETPGRPEALRLKANADRIHRWLDDQGKDSNLLPVNFLPSILAALPPDLRVDAANEILAPSGLIVRHAAVEQGDDFNPLNHLRSLLKESGEAGQSLVGMASDRSETSRLKAVREFDDLINVAKLARDSIAATLVSGEPQ